MREARIPEILRLLGEGLSIRRCAERLKCHPSTVWKAKERASKRVKGLVKKGMGVDRIVEVTHYPKGFVEEVVREMAYEIPVKGPDEGTVPFDEPFLSDTPPSEGKTVYHRGPGALNRHPSDTPSDRGGVYLGEEAGTDGDSPTYNIGGGGGEGENLDTESDSRHQVSIKSFSVDTRETPQGVYPDSVTIKKSRGGERVEERQEELSTKALRDILRRIRVPEETIETICEFYSENPEMYEQNPALLLGLLEAMGIKAQRAMFVVSQLMMALYGIPPSWGYPVVPGQPQGPAVPFWPQHNPSKESKGSDDEMDKWFRRFLQASTIQIMRSGVGQPPYPVYPPYATIIQEPVLDSTGKVVKDELGNPVVKTVINPAPLPAGRKEEHREEGRLAETMVRMAEEMAKLEKQRADALESKFMELVKSYSEERIKDLREQVMSLATRNPLAEAEDVIKRLKEMGLLSIGSAPSLEIAKLNTELQKWIHEQNMAFRKWQEEMRERRLERQEALARAKMFGNTVRQAITDLGSPLVSAFVEGYRSGQPKPNPQPRGGAVRTLELSRLSDSELAELKREAEMTLETVGRVMEGVEAELKRRASQSQ